jgi:4-hydroxy-tetrahydrodipicolinate reductase
MQKIKVMVNGIPGNMAANVAQLAASDPRLELIPHSLTGPEILDTEYKMDALSIRLIPPMHREQAITEIVEKHGSFISVDYTHPSAANSNAMFYCQHHLPFVMGTTGGNRELLQETVSLSSVSAVIAPNMAKQIVGFQAMMEWGSKTFPGLFKGYSLELKESHQKEKADTSGTARAMIRYFNSFGIPFHEKDIQKERNPEKQRADWGIPEEYLAGHAWHTYRLVSDDKTVQFVFSHNVNGRDIYARGTLDAVFFLSGKIEEGEKGKVYTMIDVLRGKS